MRRDGKDVIIQGLEAQVAKLKEALREEAARVASLERGGKLQQDLVRGLELEAAELRGENSRAKLQVDELEQLCEAHSRDASGYKAKLHQALQELEACRATVSSLRGQAAEAAASRHEESRGSSESVSAERLLRTEVQRRAAHAISSLEAAAAAAAARHAQRVEGLEGRILDLERELDSCRKRSSFSAAAETERKAAGWRAKALQEACDEEAVRCRGQVAEAEAKRCVHSKPSKPP
eukprot:CAMPEP_0173444060 /NCGR_PEP_ID=MMETSP1357-20121228/31422_1 /TAXON_ID=77926 /ORGANISM="Hemiselmis rufescens, Strain PCC563" /LENGTH=235 /DNA_ID=CAMNT_0014410059 /DNA_START=64 /DNA_END=771 /DNA_ORIENTATION=+